MTVQYQKPNDVGPMVRAVEVWAEGPEISPYATGFVPPYPKALVEDYSGYTGTTSFGTGSTSDSTGASSAQVPDAYDLEWVAGDTAGFQFFFQGVCWTDVDPVLGTRPDGITWVMSTWQAQVRSSQMTYWGYWWPPTWPMGRYITSFVITSEFQTDPDLGPGTMVTMLGTTIWPGKWKWDLQTKQYADPLDLSHYTVRTWLSGDATVDAQWTSDQLYPPSNWGVYPYA